jgi:hypothetical protein
MRKKQNTQVNAPRKSLFGGKDRFFKHRKPGFPFQPDGAKKSDTVFPTAELEDRDSCLGGKKL